MATMVCGDLIGGRDLSGSVCEAEGERRLATCTQEQSGKRVHCCVIALAGVRVRLKESGTSLHSDVANERKRQGMMTWRTALQEARLRSRLPPM